MKRCPTHGFIEVTQGKEKAYAYMPQGCVYKPSGGSAHSVGDVWVDGRYIDQYNVFVPGAKFSQHPEADIIIRNMTYTNIWGKTCKGDVTFEYDTSRGRWFSRVYISTSSSTWFGGFSKDDLPMKWF